MVNEKALANAAGVTAFVLYVACLLITLVAPDLLFNVATLIAHGVSIEPLRPANISFNFANTVGGAIIWSALTWVTFYVGGYFYNRFRE